MSRFFECTSTKGEKRSIPTDRLFDIKASPDEKERTVILTFQDYPLSLHSFRVILTTWRGKQQKVIDWLNAGVRSKDSEPIVLNIHTADVTDIAFLPDS